MHERRYRASQTDARKRDAREKIQLGGLVIKAGLRGEDRALILGALVDAAARIRDRAERARLMAIGKMEFGNDGKETGATDRPGGADDRSGSGSEGK